MQREQSSFEKTQLTPLCIKVGSEVLLLVLLTLDKLGWSNECSTIKIFALI